VRFNRVSAVLKKLCAFSLVLALAACGGGGGGGSSSSGGGSTSTPTPALTNFTTLTVDGGPTSLTTGPNGVLQDDIAYVTITICAPGSTTNCQTIDHVQVDTGSVGLRIEQSVLNASLLAAMPTQTDASSNPVGECYGYVDGYAFGSVRAADFTIGGETVSSMPLQVVGDTGAFSTIPSACSSGGGSNLNTVASLGANGIIGIGVSTTDCGVYCASGGNNGAATYYDCPSSGCVTVIARAASTTAPFQQLPNPVAAMAVDNNGTIMTLPSVPSTGSATLTGTLYFGIGTQTNNKLGSQTVLTTTTSTSNLGPGLITAIYKGQTLNESFIDSGTNLYIFVDNSITQCTGKDFTGYYCPASPTSLSPTLQGQNSATASAGFTLYNAQTLFSGDNTALPGIGGTPTGFTNIGTPYPNSFDFGLPFFFGRSVYTALEGRTAGTTVGPYFAY
jgi:hypothetical protein